MVGSGTVINVASVLVGSGAGVALGHRLPQRTRDVVTDGLGLITLLVAALSAAAVADPALRAAVGSGAVIVVLGSVLIGGIAGSLLRFEDRLEGVGERIRSVSLRRRRAAAMTADADQEPDAASATTEQAAAARFVDGFVTASLVFCVGPLGILGALSDGLGRGVDQLLLKSVLDGFASLAFAASLGWGVAASAIVVAVYQGLWTFIGWSLGGLLSDAQIAALTATGGLLLAGIGLRLLRIRSVPVGDLLPALLVAPLIVWVVSALT